MTHAIHFSNLHTNVLGLRILVKKRNISGSYEKWP
jgi:hypothetical protein